MEERVSSDGIENYGIAELDNQARELSKRVALRGLAQRRGSVHKIDCHGQEIGWINMVKPLDVARPKVNC